MTSGTDLRLAPAALAAWAGAALGARAPAAVVSVLVAGCLLAGLRPRARPAALAVLACGLAAVLAVAGRSATVRAGPLAGLARQRAEVTLDLTLTGDPVSLAGRVVGAQRLADGAYVRARADVVRRGDRAVRIREPVLVFASGPGWLGRLPGERVRVSGRLAPGRGLAATVQAHGPPVRLHRASSLARVAGRLRAGLRDAARVLPPESAGLLPGLVDGDTSALDPALREDFRRTGLTHLVAVSGTNVAAVLTVALLLARRTRLPPRLAALAAALALGGFVVLARPSPSVLRAAAMGGLALAGTATGRERDAVRLLCAAVLGLVLLDPSLARSVGFALSTFATAGLLLLGPPWRTRLAARWPGWLADAVATPLAAQAACAPVLAAAFGQLSLVALPANVLALPAVGPATVLGVVVALVAPACLPAARAVAWLAGVPAGWLVRVARTGSGVPLGLLSAPTGAGGAAVVAALVVVLAVAVARRWSRRGLAALAAGALLAGGMVWVVAPGWPPPGWRLVACDVGQGDALVVRGPGATLVVDTGPDPVAVDGCLRDLGVRRIAALVLTHLHADHVEGVPGVLRGRTVGEVVVGPLDEPVGEYDRLARWLSARHLTSRRAALGERWAAGSAAVTVLGPEAAFHGTDSDPNNSSLVLRVEVGGLVLLLTGDVEQPAQLALLSRGTPGRADVLKVPHHGSAKQVDAFLAATGAAVAIVSVGRDNPYGHPAPSTLDTLAADGLRTYRTDRDGDVAVTGTPGHVVATGRRGSGRPPRPVSAAALSWRRASEPGAWCPARAGSTTPDARRGRLRTRRRPVPAVPARARAGRVARAPPPPFRPGQDTTTRPA